MFLRKHMMDPDKGGGGGGGNPPGVHDLNPGGGGGTPPPPAVDVAALQKRLADAEAREAQYVEAINRLAERVPGEDPPPAQDEEPLDPTIAKRVDAMLSPLQQKIRAQEDLIDQQMFMQLAAAAGVTPEQVGQAEKQYQEWQETGLMTVRTVRTAQGLKRVEATPTRQEALDFILGRTTRGAMMKEAPTRSMQALRSQILGGAAFETSGGGAPTRRSEASYAELEAKPIEERLKAREAALDREGF